MEKIQMPTKNKKHRQHYVWQHYLDAWAGSGKIACRRAGTFFSTSTENVANRRDYYRLKEMTERDLQVVEHLIERGRPGFRESNRVWLGTFHALFELRRRLPPEHPDLAEMEAQLDVSINNLEEDIHSNLEGESVFYLAELREGRTDFLSDLDHRAMFSFFLAMQYFRTHSMSKQVNQVAGGTLAGFNLEAAWGVIRTILASNVGATLFERWERIRISLLSPFPGTEFVTGDQPIVNTHAVGLPVGTAVDKLEYYYPVSPIMALLFSVDDPEPGTSSRTLNADETRRLNKMISDESDEQCFATSIAVLNELA